MVAGVGVEVQADGVAAVGVEFGVGVVGVGQDGGADGAGDARPGEGGLGAEGQGEVDEFELAGVGVVGAGQGGVGACGVVGDAGDEVGAVEVAPGVRAQAQGLAAAHAAAGGGGGEALCAAAQLLGEDVGVVSSLVVVAEVEVVEDDLAEAVGVEGAAHAEFDGGLAVVALVQHELARQGLEQGVPVVQGGLGVGAGQVGQGLPGHVEGVGGQQLVVVEQEQGVALGAVLEEVEQALALEPSVEEVEVGLVVLADEVAGSVGRAQLHAQGVHAGVEQELAQGVGDGALGGEAAAVAAQGQALQARHEAGAVQGMGGGVVELLEALEHAVVGQVGQVGVAVAQAQAGGAAQQGAQVDVGAGAGQREFEGEGFAQGLAAAHFEQFEAVGCAALRDEAGRTGGGLQGGGAGRGAHGGLGTIAFGDAALAARQVDAGFMRDPPQRPSFRGAVSGLRCSRAPMSCPFVPASGRSRFAATSP